MFNKLYNKNDIITPECCYIKEWNIDVNLQKSNQLSISYFNNILYCYLNGIHEHNHLIYKDKRNFIDLRIWLDDKFITLWTYNIDNIVNILKQIQIKLIAKDYISNFDKESINLCDYDIIFTSYKNDILNVIRCNLIEFYIMPNNEIVDNTYERMYHILNPAMKEKFKNNGMIRKIKERYFKEAQNINENKFGKIDIAKYHMLIYGE